MSQCLGMVLPPGLKGGQQRELGPLRPLPARGLLTAKDHLAGPEDNYTKASPASLQDSGLPGLTSTLGEHLTYKLGISWKQALPGNCVKTV